MSESRLPIISDILRERLRQDQLKASGKFKHTCADAEMSNEQRLAVLAEEFGEVARAVCENDRVNMREELIQVAAVSLAFVEALDKESL